MDWYQLFQVQSDANTSLSIMEEPSLDIEKIQANLREFAKRRNWAQFHSPKNLSMALSVEVSELVEHFQWLTQEQSRNLSQVQRAEVAEEMADIQIYLLMLADKLDVDLATEVENKIVKNAEKYPSGT